jgi:hypothetical protein
MLAAIRRKRSELGPFDVRCGSKPDVLKLGCPLYPKRTFGGAVLIRRSQFIDD